MSNVTAKRAAIWQRVQARFNEKQKAPWTLKKLTDLRYRLLNGNQQKKDKSAVGKFNKECSKTGAGLNRMEMPQQPDPDVSVGKHYNLFGISKQALNRLSNSSCV